MHTRAKHAENTCTYHQTVQADRRPHAHTVSVSPIVSLACASNSIGLRTKYGDTTTAQPDRPTGPHPHPSIIHRGQVTMRVAVPLASLLVVLLLVAAACAERREEEDPEVTACRQQCAR